MVLVFVAPEPRHALGCRPRAERLVAKSHGYGAPLQAERCRDILWQRLKYSFGRISCVKEQRIRKASVSQTVPGSEKLASLRNYNLEKPIKQENE